MTTSMASEDRWPNASAKGAATAAPPNHAPATARGLGQPPSGALGLLDDAALLLLVALLFPVLILLIGMPVAFLARLVMTIVQRL